VWSYIIQQGGIFKNTTYNTEYKEHVLHPRPSAVKLWQQYFLKTVSCRTLSR